MEDGDTNFNEDNAVSLEDALQSLKPHDHLCLIYETFEEWKNVVAPFIKIGLDRGEKCIYVVDQHTANQMRNILRQVGVEVSKLEKSGQLTIIDHSEAYTSGGHFDPEQMISLLIDETNKALNEGYKALRVTGEMTWVLRDLPGSERLLEYESKLNKELFPYHPCLAICQYDRNEFDPEIIKGVIMTHPLLIKGGQIYKNFYYVPPEEFLNSKRAEREVEQWLNNLEREREIKDKKDFYAELLNKSSQPFGVGDPQGNIVLTNPAFNQLVGYKEQEINQIDWIKALTPSKWAHKEAKELQKLKDTGKPVRYEKEYIRSDGTLIPVELFVQPSYDQQDNINYYYAFVTDITQRKKAEKLLKESENRYRMIGQLITDFAYSCVHDNDGRYKVDWITESFYNITGFTYKELELKRCWLFSVHPEDEKIANHQLNELKPGMKNAETFRIISKDGEIRWLRNHIECVEDEQHDLRIYGAAQDITEQKTFMDNLRWELEINQSLSRIYAPLISEKSSMEDIAYVILEECKKLTRSEKGYVGSVDPESHDLVVHTHTSMMEECHMVEAKDKIRFSAHENGSYPSLWGNCLNLGHGFYTNHPSQHKSSLGIPEGHIKLKNFISVPVIVDGELMGQIALANAKHNYRDHDLEALERIASFYALAIQRITFQEELVNSLHDKELLLREIHHRVKNNLQIIASLLSLQSYEADDKETKDFCKVSQDRVRSMALIHEKLYRSHNISQIDLKEYLESLTNSLLSSYAAPATVKLELKINNVSLDLDTAIPCGLILNELVTNSIKYAFPDKNGTITIQCLTQNQGYSLIISDDGIGLPEDIELESADSLGLKIVMSLVKQIDGKIQVDRDQGTKYIITFTEQRYQNRL